MPQSTPVCVRGHRQYRQIKLCVDGNPVHFRDLRINFRNGGLQDVTIRSRINAGECTRVIDLEGGANIKTAAAPASWVNLAARMTTSEQDQAQGIVQ